MIWTRAGPVGGTGSIVIDTTALDVAAMFDDAEVTKLLGMTKDMDFKLQYAVGPR